MDCFGCYVLSLLENLVSIYRCYYWPQNHWTEDYWSKCQIFPFWYFYHRKVLLINKNYCLERIVFNSKCLMFSRTAAFALNGRPEKARTQMTKRLHHQRPKEIRWGHVYYVNKLTLFIVKPASHLPMSPQRIFTFSSMYYCEVLHCAATFFISCTLFWQ